MSEPDWEIARRWESYGGELTVNLMRIIAVFIFYGIQLLNYHVFHVEGVDAEFHAAMTAICVGWGCLALLVHLLLLRRVFPLALKYIVTAVDLTLVTGALLISDGPMSPLLVLYFLIMVASVLRFSHRLVAFTTVGCLTSYLVILGNARWYRPELRVERYRQLIFAVAVLLGGALLTFAVRRARQLAERYAERRLVERGRE